MAMSRERRFRELLVRAWNHSPFYREVFMREGICERDLPYIALEHLPVVSKTDLMVRFDEAVTDRRLRKRDLEAWVAQDTDPLNLFLDEYIVMHSSGGSQIYSFVPHTRNAWRHLTSTAAPQLLPFTQGMERPLRSAFFMKSEGHFVGATSMGLASQAAHDVLRLSIFDPVEEIWARLNAFQPERISTYASTLLWLAEWTLEGRLRIAPRSVLVSGDRLTAAMRAQIKKAWNAEIYDLYAAVESLYIAARRPEHEEFRVFTDLNLLEVVDTANRMVRRGERGRVLLTSLVHTTLPIIRFDLRDIAVLGKAGFGAETLLALDGKAHDSLPIRLANGDIAALEVHELAQVELPGIEKMQFVHRSPVDVEIRYQSPHNLDSEVEGAFRLLLAQKTATMETLKIRRVERILNDSATLKLRVVTPDREVITPTSLIADDTRGSSSPSARSIRTDSLFASDLTGSIDRRFSEIALRHPQQLAAMDGETQLTYGELHRRATQVSGELLRRGFDPARPVAVLCGHRLELLPLILGVVRAGGFYVPLDPHLPTGRLQTILADARAEFVLASAAQRDAAATLAAEQQTVLCLDEMKASPPERMPTLARAAPACLLYTSGTTGMPKGVVLSHSAVLSRAARYAADYGINPEDRLSLLQSFAVSAGIREIYGALLTGATLMFYDIRARGLGELAQWLNHTGITVFYAVPTIFRLFLETLTDELFPRVRVVRLGGEPARESDVSGFRQHFPRGCILANGYAATETDTICQTFIDHDTRIVAGRVPAGTPVSGVEVTLRDERGDPATGAVGEIRVAGTMLASGYWDARSGQVQPFELPIATGDLGYQLDDGRVFLAGRRDLIVNVHGYRIHLGEIERAVSRVPGVVEAVAVPRPAAQGDTTIVVYFVAKDESGPGTAELRHAVAAVIPRAAEPTAYVKLPALPRLPGGKVNRNSLVAQSTRSVPRSVATEPVYASALERRLAHLWRDVLQIPAPEREADFFDLGGDSVSFFRVLNRIEIEFGVELSAAEFAGRSVLAELAHAVEQLRAGSAGETPQHVDSKTDRETLPGPAKPTAARATSFVAPRSPTEHQIAAIWEDFFDVSPIGAYDNYFDLGGDASRAAALVAKIEETCGRVLSPSVLLQAPTVADLAAAITRVESGFNEPLTTLRASGQRSPLFFLHNDYGRGLYTHALARCLDSDRPFYAVHLHGLNEPEYPTTLEAIAASRIQAIRGARPHGPYVLGGHCDGGLIALEMARQLQEAGEHVELVVMVDTYAPSRGFRSLRHASNAVSRFRGRFDRISGQIAWRLRYYKTRLEILRRSNVRSQTDYILRKLMGLARPVVAMESGHAARTERAHENAMRSDFTESRRVHRGAVHHYVPSRYSSPVVLFRAEQLPAYRPDLGWSRLLSRLEVAVIPGDHHTCITRHVGAFGARLNEILRRADAGVQHTISKSSNTGRQSRAQRPAQGPSNYRPYEQTKMKPAASGQIGWRR
jgi:amino acid adenylation domain-containing protein